MTGYLLDANIFIHAKNLHYGFDFCPAFWDWLVVQNEAGKVASIRPSRRARFSNGNYILRCPSVI